MASRYSEEEIGSINEKLYQKLHPLFSLPVFDFSEFTESSMDQLLSFIAPCIGKDVSNLTKISTRIGNGPHFLAKLKEATIGGGKNYEFVLDQFSTSVNTLSRDQIDPIIASFLEEIRPELEGFLRRPQPMTLWEPDETLPHATFLKNLKIPATSKNQPDMLLHDLGNFQRDKFLRKQLQRLFHDKISTGRYVGTTLLNTSGSGKTRMVLEGLCLKWGLYFTCHVDQTGHGSVDLQEALETRIPSDPCFQTQLPMKDFARVNDANCEIAQDRFSEVLLARLCIFLFFCQVAADVSGEGITDRHKQFWVILQLRPSCVGTQYWDIFSELTDKIKGIDVEYRKQLIFSKVKELAKLLGKTHAPPFFCIVDEAQIASTSLMEAFMTSEPGKTTQRSSLRELARAFAIPALAMSLNLTGTGIRRDVILDILTSPVFKDLKPVTVTHFGAFTIAAEQIAYMKQFMPPKLAEEDTWIELFKRVSHWLKGRYRFTAAYMKELLVTGFQRPHLMLNAFIRFSTRFVIPGTVDEQWSEGFQPTDSQKYWEKDGEAVPSDEERFQFDKLKQDSALENVIRTCTTEFWMRSVISAIVGNSHQLDLISCGFARYADNDVGSDENAKVALDEPLALLALGEWLQIRNLPLAETLRVKAAQAVTSAEGANGLEEYLALYLSLVFDEKTPLTDIFRFHPHMIPPKWAEKPATLVALYLVNREDEAEDLREGNVDHHARPSVSIGKAAPSVEETMKWLGHGDRAPICFPDRLMGPDIMFVLKLGDGKGSRIWVALQSKFGSQDILKSEVILKAVPTVTPGAFYGMRNDKPARKSAGVRVADFDEADSNDSDKATKKKKREEIDKKAREENKRKVLLLMDALPNRLRTRELEDEKGALKTIPDFTKKIILWRAEQDSAEEKTITKKAGKAPKRPDLPDFPLTSEQAAILQGAGVHSVLRVVVGWPAATALHERACRLVKNATYFDEEYHPIVELNVGHWGKTMQPFHKSAGTYVDRWKGAGKRLADGEGEGAPASKKMKVLTADYTTKSVPVDLEPTLGEILDVERPEGPDVVWSIELHRDTYVRNSSTPSQVPTSHRLSSPPRSATVSTFSRAHSPMD